VKYLHSKKIIHRDLKSLNALVDERDGAKLCDFGLAKTKTTSKSVMSAGEKGNMLWMAPGLIRQCPLAARSKMIMIGLHARESTGWSAEAGAKYR
jgi:serine/threonine protein kinase